MTLRYQTWRRSIHVGMVLMALSVAGLVFFGGKPWAFVFTVLFWTVIIGTVVFNIAVGLLKKAGLLELTYSDADHASYLYNAEKLQGQMTEERRKRKEE